MLVVDDEAAVGTSINIMLKKSGYAVDVVRDGGDALDRLRTSPGHYDILITDHLMCRVSGLEFLLQLPMNTFNGKVIVLSAFLTVELEAQYRSLGADRILRKPFDVDELRTTIEECVEEI